MDDFSLDANQHLHALRGLERINRWSRSIQILWEPIRADLVSGGNGRSFKALDIATGSGDVPMGLWRRARTAGLQLEIHGCDNNPRTVEYAQQRANQAKVPIRFFQMDPLMASIPFGYDFLICSLFLYHLDEQKTVALLRSVGQAAGRLLLVNDLIRSPQGLALAYLGTRLLSTSAVVHTDGPRSVRGAYTVDEIRSLAKQAGLENVVISRHWPCRFLMIWRR